MKQAAVCIIENSHGQILILQRSKIPHGFGLPGGKVDPGETVLQAAIREVWEETRIVVDISEEDKVGVVQSAVKEFEVHVYYHKLDESFSPTKTIISEEHVGYAWTSKPYDGFDLAGNTKKMIKLWPK